MPTYHDSRRWSDRVQILKRPLFAGYVFCRFPPDLKVPILRTPGVRSIVSFGREMLPVPDEDIERVRRMLNSGAAIEPWPFLKAGQRVRVQSGPLSGLEGILVELRNSFRVVVGMELLQRSVAVQLNRAQICPIE